MRATALSRRSVLGALAAPALIGRARAAASGTVTLYTSVPSTFANRLAEAFNKAGTGVTLQVFSAETFQVYQRLVAELQAGRLKADLYQVSDVSTFVELKEAKALMSYDSETYQHYPAAFKDPDALWINSRSLVTLFAYNHTVIRPEDAPKTWDDWVDTKWSGKQADADPRVDGDALNWYYVMRETKGVGWWEKYARNKPQLFRRHGAMSHKLISGELPMTEQLDYLVYSQVTQHKAPITAVYPEVLSLTMTPLGIMKQAPNPEGAKIAFDWLLSKTGQEALMQANGVYSMRDDATPLPGKPPLSSLAIHPIDPVAFTKARTAMQEEFIRIFDL